MGWRTAQGRTEGNPPSQPGWVRVEWQVSGYSKNYRFGTAAGQRADLVIGHDDRRAVAGELQPDQLRCTFSYLCGTQHAHCAKFDIRDETCLKVAPIKHGDVVRTPKGQSSTCIGLKYDPGEKKIQMWFHVEGKEGCGVYEDEELATLKVVGHRDVQQVRPEDDDVGAASDGEIEHDDREWVGKNLRPTLQYLSKTGKPIKLDVGDAVIAKFKLPYKSGDVLKDRVDGETMTCLGVGKDPMAAFARESLFQTSHRRIPGAIAELWFHVEGAPGAGVNPSLHKHLRRFDKVGTRPVEPQQDEFGPALADLDNLDLGDLQCDFEFPKGLVRASKARFDVRPEFVSKYTGFIPGTVLQTPLKADARVTLIGIMPDDGTPKVWWHYEDSSQRHPGAGLMEGWEVMRKDFVDTGPRPNVFGFSC